MTTDYVGTRTNEDQICPICHKAVEIQHTPFKDTVTGNIAHDYCFRTETAANFQARVKASHPVVFYGSVRTA